jgi:hypothetical protein
LRLVSQRIVGSSFTDPTHAVRWMLALQAQDFPGAKWSVGLRTSGSTDAAVEAALASGEIVRSWPMRGTLHFTAAEDLHWILGLTSARLVAGAAARRAALDLDDAILGRAREVAVARLTGAKELTREQLLAELDLGGVSTQGQRGYHVLWHLAQTGTLCFGPPRGKQQTFVLLDEWVKRPRLFERDEALGELARRYFASHGPATLRDFRWWTKLTARDAKIGLAIARPQLADLLVDDATYWMAPDAEDRLSQLARVVTGAVVALPGFDEYVLGYQDRGAVLAAEHSERIVPGGNGVFLPTIVVDGQIVGTWRRSTRAKESVIDATPFTTLTATSTKRLEHAVKEYGRFLDVAARQAVSFRHEWSRTHLN